MVKNVRSTFSKAYIKDNDFMLARKVGTGPVKLLFDKSLMLHAQTQKIDVMISRVNF